MRGIYITSTRISILICLVEWESDSAYPVDIFFLFLSKVQPWSNITLPGCLAEEKRHRENERGWLLDAKTNNCVRNWPRAPARAPLSQQYSVGKEKRISRRSKTVGFLRSLFPLLDSDQRSAWASERAKGNLRCAVNVSLPREARGELPNFEWASASSLCPGIPV